LKTAILPGVALWREFLDVSEQEQLAAEVARIIDAAPLYTSVMPRTGKPMSVRMTNCGSFGWMSDREGGYRYVPRHPITNKPWPDIPQALLRIWREVANFDKPPQACLVNVYDVDASMGLHQDRDEADFTAPILSISLGADCKFRIGGAKRGGKTLAVTLSSGDVLTLGGAARLAFHGVDKILPTLAPRLQWALPEGAARINLTLRRVE
jgi:DNA oxidative demethylase